MARASVASSFVACRRCLEGQVARASATCPDLRDHRMTVQSFSALQGPSVLPDHPLPSIMRQRPRGVPPRAPPLHNGTLCKPGPQAQHASAPRGPCPSAPRGSLCCNTARAHAMRDNEQRTANSKQQTATATATAANPVGARVEIRACARQSRHTLYRTCTSKSAP